MVQHPIVIGFQQVKMETRAIFFNLAIILNKINLDPVSVKSVSKYLPMTTMTTTTASHNDGKENFNNMLLGSFLE